MTALVAIAGGRTAPPPARPLSLPMRLALGYLQAGALFLDPPRGPSWRPPHWRSLAFRDRTVTDPTMRALAARGLASILQPRERHTMAYAVTTPEGSALYAAIGGSLRDLPRPPPEAEPVLAVFDDAIETIAHKLAAVSRTASHLGPRIASAEAVLAALAEQGTLLTSHLAELTALAASLTEKRDALRRHIAERAAP